MSRRKWFRPKAKLGALSGIGAKYSQPLALQNESLPAALRALYRKGGATATLEVTEELSKSSCAGALPRPSLAELFEV